MGRAHARGEAGLLRQAGFRGLRLAQDAQEAAQCQGHGQPPGIGARPGDDEEEAGHPQKQMMAVGEAFCSVSAELIGKDIHRGTKVVLKRLQQAVSLEAGATAVLGVICTPRPGEIL